ncbi:PfkB family carbohydrate kinase [Propionicimonas sp. T2.31MG-18]|uniref:PfkB family carbohydrate kinase n=1 Tax=Propionicimonas sp. T2.31MG-18 TaxID=3157620 RepID=UPI0036726EEB
MCRWAELGPAICVATQGVDDVLLLADGQLSGVATLPTRVVDTVGAGDSFMAGLISSLLEHTCLAYS